MVSPKDRVQGYIRIRRILFGYTYIVVTITHNAPLIINNCNSGDRLEGPSAYDRDCL